MAKKKTLKSNTKVSVSKVRLVYKPLSINTPSIPSAVNIKSKKQPSSYKELAAEKDTSTNQNSPKSE